MITDFDKIGLSSMSDPHVKWHLAGLGGVGQMIQGEEEGENVR